MKPERQIPLFGETASVERRDGSTRAGALSVSALNAAARRLVERSLGERWVIGEVSGWKTAASGHRYFSLRDDRAQLRCVMFGSDARRLPAEPEEGMEVVAYGQVTVYEPRGSFQLVVRVLEATGEGLWRLAFERLRRKLAAEGLLDPGRKRRPPAVPARVGVVTSRSGAALRDVLTVIRRRAPWTHVLIHDCRVQGDGAALDIRRALETIGRLGGVDVVILTRGGGSVEDLWPFNEEPVARAVAASPVPVISAVGHEVDVTIADLVADLRAPTPSAAAELAVPDRRALRVEVGVLTGRLVAGLRRRTERGRERGTRLGERLVRAIDLGLERRTRRLDHAGARLDALSPLGTLRRGFAVALGPQGRVLRRVGMFREEAPFRLRVVDGIVRCRAEGSETLEEGGAA